ncbi:MAG: V-type ATP synthase subunit E family protein [Conexivisphaerales archaeon]
MGTEALSGAEALLRELADKKAKALKSLEQEFEAKLKEVETQTAAAIAEIQQRAQDESKLQAEKERNRIIGASKLQAKKLIFDATEKMMKENLESLQQVLKSYTESEPYKDLLLRMANYASRRLGRGMVIKCREKDKAILNDKGFKVISSDLQSMGGIIAYNSNRSLELDLRLEELLRIKEEQVRAAIAGKG